MSIVSFIVSSFVADATGAVLVPDATDAAFVADATGALVIVDDEVEECVLIDE